MLGLGIANSASAFLSAELDVDSLHPQGPYSPRPVQEAERVEGWRAAAAAGGHGDRRQRSSTQLIGGKGFSVREH